MDSKELWTALANGDAAARDALLEEHLSLVHHVARQLSRSLAAPADFDELVSCGTIGLMSALDAFDASRGLAFSTSYWFSKTLDYVSSMNVAGSAPRLVSGENDIAQNPFDLRSEHGPSLFDAVREQWGLRLERGEGTLNMVIVESVERPTEN